MMRAHNPPNQPTDQNQTKTQPNKMPMLYSDRLLTGCQLLAALGFFSVAGGPFGILAAIMMLFTLCKQVGVCGLRFTVLLSLLAAAEAGFITYAIYSFDQVWDFVEKKTWLPQGESALSEDTVDQIHEYLIQYDWASYVTFFSSACWLFCAMNLLFFIENYKKALVLIESGLEYSGSAHGHSDPPLKSVHTTAPTVVKGFPSVEKQQYTTPVSSHGNFYDECSA